MHVWRRIRSVSDIGTHVPIHLHQEYIPELRSQPYSIPLLGSIHYYITTDYESKFTNK